MATTWARSLHGRTVDGGSDMHGFEVTNVGWHVCACTSNGWPAGQPGHAGSVAQPCTSEQKGRKDVESASGSCSAGWQRRRHKPGRGWCSGLDPAPGPHWKLLCRCCRSWRFRPRASMVAQADLPKHRRKSELTPGNWPQSGMPGAALVLACRTPGHSARV